MGGTNEKILDAGKSAGTSKSTEIGTGKKKLRLHENAGEVHFHDDTAGLKVAVPVATFMKEWPDFSQQRIAEEGAVLHFVDATRNTVAVLKSISRFKKGKFLIDIEASIVPAVVDDNVTKLNDFAAGK